MALNNIKESYLSEADNFGKKTFIKRPITRMAVAAIIITCIVLAGGAAYAGKTLTDWQSVISFFDKDNNETQIVVSDKAFFKELPENLPIIDDGEPMIPMTHEEVEITLGFDILGSSISPENTAYNYDAFLNINSNVVAKVSLWCPNFIKESETKNIDYSAHILSTDAEEGYILPMIEGNDAAGGKVYVGTYELENLSTSTVIYTFDDQNKNFKATFVYDNIYYTLSSNHYSLDEFLDVLGALE